jgi:myo-inositol-1(or 4)-monophosphatase
VDPVTAPPADPPDAVLATALATAHRLADGARALSLRGFRTPLEVTFKPDASPVTLVDRAVEAFLRERLADAFPTHGLAGEEFEATRPDAALRWTIDPIDGTASYVTGLPLWGTMLALLHEDVPVLGLVDIPVLCERWSATRGGGTIFEGRDGARAACATSACRALSSARLCLPAPEGTPDARAAAVARLAGAVALRRHGGDCYAYGLLACGHLDLIVECGLDDHDFLPMVPIVEEAGGVLSDWSGRPLTPRSDGDVVVAATPALHAAALRLLQD